jgi:uncharacterized membrane protein
MRIVLMIVAALLGAAFASESRAAFGAVLSAVAVFALAEILALRRRAERLEQELTILTRRTAEPQPRAQTEARDAAALDAAALKVAGARRRPHEPTGQSSAWQATAADAPEEPMSDAELTEAALAASEPAERSREARESPRVAPQPSSYIRPQPRPPALPPESPIIVAIREWFTGGNTLVRVGIVILFIGVAFLLRYVAEHTYVPIQLRLSGVAVGGVVLLALGWRLRAKRPGYALALQGGAIGILYLTVFASLRLFSVLPPGAAFALLVLLAAFSAALAILQNSLAFSLLALGCGFMAPVLASTGQGNHVVLFSYYGVLNLGILAIAWFKSWRPLNVAGFLFTFVIGTAWGVLKYSPDFFTTTEPFLVGHFAMYVAIAVLFSIRQKPVLRGYVDGTIVFGVPAVAFGLQAALVHDKPFALAYSAAAVSAVYLALAWIIHRGKRETQRLLVEAFMALGVVFLTLAVPLALDGRWSSATWALEGAALVWIGCRQGRRLPRAFGTLLQIASGVIFLFDVNAPYSALPILNSAYLGGVMIAVGSVFAARSLRKHDDDLFNEERMFAPMLLAWGLLWWLGSGLMEIDRHLPERYEIAAALVLFAVTALICSELKRRFDLRLALAAAMCLMPVMVLFGLFVGVDQFVGGTSKHPLAFAGWAAWPLAFAAFYWVAWRSREVRTEEDVLTSALHVASVWLLVSLGTWEFAWQVDRAVNGSGSWPAIAWAIIPGVALLALPKLRDRLQWPVGAHAQAYVAIAGSGLAGALVAWSLVTNITMSGDPRPLPYLPLLNPLDVAQVFALLVLLRFGLHLRSARYPVMADISWKPAAGMLAALVFIWLNAALLRTLHQWFNVPLQLEPMLASTLVQTSLSIFWTVLALATMLLATRRGSRIVWITGAVLLAVVVAKLFLVDLSRVGTVERIVSFVVVGLLMLVVGYFSPLPPAREPLAREGST